MAQERAFAEVIGDPIDHSRSPAIHGFWLAELGIQADYRPIQVRRAGLGDYVASRRAADSWRGCNVTMPLKLDALTLADEATDMALVAGAANILLPDEGMLVAGNTDVGAVMSLLTKLRKSGAPMSSVTLLGTGGAARAVLVALRTLDVRSVRIQARDVSEAYKLAVEFGMELQPMPFDAPIESDGLIQATPLGMNGMIPLDVDFDAMPANGWVFDFVTSPRRTHLLLNAQDRGLTTIDGIAMLIEQAAASFKLLFGAAAPRDRDAELLALLEA